MVTLNGVRARARAAWSAFVESNPQEAESSANESAVTATTASDEWWDLLPFAYHRIQLADGNYTSPDGIDASRNFRTDVVLENFGGSIKGRSAIDLGCLEGAFAIEFGRLGASRVVGVEARDVSVRRACLARDLIGGLNNVEFVLGDVMHELQGMNKYDVVFASGILYHLDDPATFLRLAHDACSGVVLVDTHVADPNTVFHGCSAEITERELNGEIYRGRNYFEFAPDATEVDRAPLLLAAWENSLSFWPVEEDLVRMMKHAGFGQIEKVDTTSVSVEHWRVDPRSRVMYICRP